jgi:nucleotide-binding universal stress UspA family protein
MFGRPLPESVPAGGREDRNMYEKILLALDGTTDPDESATRAFELARQHGAAVNALYVVDTTTTGEPALSSLELLNIDGEDTGLARLAELAKRARRVGVEFSWKLQHGPFEEALAAYGAEVQPDLLVIDGLEREGEAPSTALATGHGPPEWLGRSSPDG